MSEEVNKVEVVSVPAEEIEKFEQAPDNIPVVEDNTEKKGE